MQMPSSGTTPHHVSASLRGRGQLTQTLAQVTHHRAITQYILSKLDITCFFFELSSLPVSERESTITLP
jgi:hypothetical protein